MIIKESLASTCSPFNPKSFKDDGSFHNDILGMSIFERSVETPKGSAQAKINSIGKYLQKDFNCQQERRSASAAKGTRATSFNFFSENVHNEIRVEDDSDEDDEEEVGSFMASRYDSPQDDELSISDGSGYQELRKPKSSHSKNSKSSKKQSK